MDEEDSFGLDEEIKTILFICIGCGEEDDVPEFVVQEFQEDKKQNEEVETICPRCNGAMRRARKVPSDFTSLGTSLRSR
ncbi:hypothetical protein J6TS1_01670 [Siminovitchia terrae]|uniref:Uncharacterized protein n=1 Tax=Siminovitchia terrae TaxID=1914933 RepID=A0A429X706_SIMTE|nr:hypothetical protein [Siminovitchia terrae]RST59225.1 hypothetical protein D5F11_012770 [Siminovitchia terrae]GIN90192.1 hypothetical protein J22TS1_12430 [Siminovitchia terrae]GIN94297.1 hypothetical protein J6TS1_01670 [Siminovitchia terrae]